MKPHRVRVAAALASAGALMAVAGTAAPAAAQATNACEVTYQADWWAEGPDAGGFVALITIENLGDPVDGWTLAFTLPPGQSLQVGWSATWPASGATGNLTATSLPWNGALDQGESTEIGFYGRWSGAFAEPASFRLNGAPCVGERQPPVVAVTFPTPGALVPLQRLVTLVAEASSPQDTIDRVEFYLNDALVGADTTPPYCVHVIDLAFAFFANTVHARAVDGGNPPLSTDSEPAAFNVVTIPPPQPAHIVPTPILLEINAGGSAVLNVRLSVETTAEVEMAEFGDAGLTMTPSSFTLNPGNWDTGQDVTVQAPLAAEGKRAQVVAQVADPDIGGEATPVMVVGADPADRCGQGGS